MEVLYFDIVRREVPYDLKMLPEVMSKSDVVNFHVPLTPWTKHLINYRTLSGMKKDILLINTSRGQVHYEQALWEALSQKRIAESEIGVIEEDPLPSNSPLTKLENVVLTPQTDQHMRFISVV